MWVWAPGHLPLALKRRAGLRGRPGRAPGTIPSCIICKYCEVKPYPHPSLRPFWVLALPEPHRAKVPTPPCLCPLLLRHHYCKLADLSSGHSRPTLSGPLSSHPGFKALSLLSPKNPQCGGKGPGKRRAGLSHCWEGFSSPKVPPGPCLGGTFAVSALSPSRTVGGHRGALQQRASQGTPTFSLKFPARIVPRPEPLVASYP